MSIWILAIVLCAVFAAIGFFSGAIRTIMMWVGVILASIITGAIAPKLISLMPKIGIVHPLWIQAAPYIIVFSLFALIVYGVGFAIHHKIAMVYKYSRDDYSRAKWERMNHHVGLALGLVIAVQLFFVIAKVAYPAGYLTAQVGAGENNPAWVSFLSSVRRDMSATGLDKSVAALDKTPAAFYDASDIVGIICNNPQIQPRLANYPYFLSLGQRAEFQELAADKDYNNLIFQAPGFGPVVNHPNTQRLLANQEIIDIVKGVDLKDLKAYLLTGKSAKYDDERILGRWILDKDAVMTFVRKTRPNIKGDELMAVKKGVEQLPDITLINTLDNKTLVKAEGGGAPAEAAAAAPEAAPVAQEPERYTRMRQQLNANAPRPAAPAPKKAAPAASPVLQIAGEGEWKSGSVSGYEMTIPDPKGKPQTLLAAIQDDELTISKDGLSLIFYRAE
jgi:hypothetical protein